MNWEFRTDIYTPLCVKQIVGRCCTSKGARSVLWNDLEGWDVGGRLKREGIYVYTQLIHFVIQQKLTQH